MYFHPNLRDAAASFAYTDALYELFFKEHKQWCEKVEKEFQKNLRNGWKDEVRGTTKEVLEFKGSTNWAGGKTYAWKIDSIRLWRNAQVHYKDHLLDGVMS